MNNQTSFFSIQVARSSALVVYDADGDRLAKASAKLLSFAYKI